MLWGAGLPASAKCRLRHRLRLKGDVSHYEAMACEDQVGMVRTAEPVRCEPHGYTWNSPEAPRPGLGGYRRWSLDRPAGGDCHEQPRPVVARVYARRVSSARSCRRHPTLCQRRSALARLRTAGEL